MANNQNNQRYILLCIILSWISQIICALHFFLPFWLDVDVKKDSVKYDRTEGLYLRCESPAEGQNETDKMECEWVKNDGASSKCKA